MVIPALDLSQLWILPRQTQADRLAAISALGIFGVRLSAAGEQDADDFLLASVVCADPVLRADRFSLPISESLQAALHLGFPEPTHVGVAFPAQPGQKSHQQ